MTPLAIACMVRAALLAHDAGAPVGVPLTIRRRDVLRLQRGGDPLCILVIARHVVEWDAGDDARGLVIADVVGPLG